MPKDIKPRHVLLKNEPEWKDGKPPRGRGWPFTDFNTTAGRDAPPIYENIKTNYTIAGYEICPETKKVHWQGYLYCSEAHTWSAMKKLFPNTVHFEWPAKGPLANMRYCSKEGHFFQTGKLPRMGERTDITDMYDLVKGGADDYEVMTTMPTQFVKYYKAIDRVRLTIDRHEHKHWSPVKVVVFWGPSDTMKSRRVRKLDPDVVMIPHKEKVQLWFDGYQGHKSILFEEFYGTSFSFEEFLNICDGYKFNVAIKGGFAWKRWDTVYFTSNKHPKDWFGERSLTREFIRRFDKIYYCQPPKAREIAKFPDEIAPDFEI